MIYLLREKKETIPYYNYHPVEENIYDHVQADESIYDDIINVTRKVGVNVSPFPNYLLVGITVNEMRLPTTKSQYSWMYGIRDIRKSWK